MNFDEVSVALADVLSTRIRTLTYVEPDPAPPCAFVFPPTPFDYRQTYEDSFPVTLNVLLLASAVSARAGSGKLNEWVSTDGDDALIPIVQDDGHFQVTQLLTYGITALIDGGTQYYSATLEVVCFSLD